MAEATLAVAACHLGVPLRVDWVNRNVLGKERRIVRQEPHASGTRAIVSMGPPLRGIEARIVRGGDVLPEDSEGEIQIRGRAVMTGYLNRAREDSHSGDWLRTGDLGYISRGEIFLTGRLKQMVIVNGVNYHAEDCEKALVGLPRTFRGRCAALDLGSGDALTLVIETQEDSPAARRQLAADALARVRLHVGLHRVRVVLARPRTIPFTTSGKPRRLALRDAIANGTIRPQSLEFTEDGSVTLDNTLSGSASAE
jgi:acyl-CoA synthetase (AMP-forming)/AMP-acid ligase II